MSKVSFILPSRNERFLSNTIADILKNTSDSEVIAVCEGYWPDPPLQDDKRLVIIHRGSPKGLRAAINSAASIAKGEYICKLDPHCLVGIGFDEILQKDCDDNWVIIPRRYSLDAENWAVQPRRPIRDYHYLCYPDPNKKHDGGMHGVEWPERSAERKQYEIDETLSLQGSCYFMKKSWFNRIGGLFEGQAYGIDGMASEPAELGNKTWLSGGQLMVNKKTYYAHLHKGKAYGRGYNIDEKSLIAGHNYVAMYWMNNSWKSQTRKMEWLIDRFWPVPTWPDNWKEKDLWK